MFDIICMLTECSLVEIKQQQRKNKLEPKCHLLWWKSKRTHNATTIEIHSIVMCAQRAITINKWSWNDEKKKSNMNFFKWEWNVPHSLSPPLLLLMPLNFLNERQRFIGFNAYWFLFFSFIFCFCFIQLFTLICKSNESTPWSLH